jgi:hypothetical protein
MKSTKTIEELADSRGVVELQNKLKLPPDFFKKLLDEDDWSFVIKLHALIEAACSDLLLHRLNEPGLRNIVSRLELSNKSFGKLAFIKELELLGDESRRYISSLSEWRNNFVHNIQNCSASLSVLVSKMEGGAVKKFAQDFAPHEMSAQKFARIRLPGSPESLAKAVDNNTLMERAKKDPKVYIWLGAYTVLASMVDIYDYSEYILHDRAMEMTGVYDDDDADHPEEDGEDIPKTIN